MKDRHSETQTEAATTLARGRKIKKKKNIVGTGSGAHVGGENMFCRLWKGETEGVGLARIGHWIFAK